MLHIENPKDRAKFDIPTWLRQNFPHHVPLLFAGQPRHARAHCSRSRSVLTHCLECVACRVSGNFFYTTAKEGEHRGMR